ncbi:MAG: outer membrane beta-barrel protein [Bacteroidota bacterium]
MKKITLIAALAASCLYGTAQTKIGVGLGVNSFRSEFQGLMSLPRNPVITPSLHVLLQTPISTNFSLIYGAGYLVKGSKADYKWYNTFQEFHASGPDGGAYLKYTSDTYSKDYYNYVEVPVSLNYQAGAVGIQAGGYAALFVGGKHKYHLKSEVINGPAGTYPVYSDIKGESNINPGNSQNIQGNGEDKLRQFDFGVQVGASVKLYKGFTLFGQYSRSVKNNLPNFTINNGSGAKSPYAMYQSGFSLRLVYLFGGRED